MTLNERPNDVNKHTMAVYNFPLATEKIRALKTSVCLQIKLCPLLLLLLLPWGCRSSLPSLSLSLSLSLSRSFFLVSLSHLTQTLLAKTLARKHRFIRTFTFSTYLSLLFISCSLSFKHTHALFLSFTLSLLSQTQTQLLLLLLL